MRRGHVFLCPQRREAARVKAPVLFCCCVVLVAVWRRCVSYLACKLFSFCLFFALFFVPAGKPESLLGVLGEWKGPGPVWDGAAGASGRRVGYKKAGELTAHVAWKNTRGVGVTFRGCGGVVIVCIPGSSCGIAQKHDLYVCTKYIFFVSEGLPLPDRETLRGSYIPEGSCAPASNMRQKLIRAHSTLH